MLHIGLWVVQVLLALSFCMAGAVKSLTPIDELATNMAWVTAAPAALVRFVGRMRAASVTSYEGFAAPGSLVVGVSPDSVAWN